MLKYIQKIGRMKETPAMCYAFLHDYLRRSRSMGNKYNFVAAFMS